MKRTILVVHPGAFGDILLAVPAIRVLSARYPQHEIGLIAAAAASRLLWECGLINAWFSLEGQACLGLFSEATTISGELHAWLNRCDLAMLWMDDEEGLIGSRLQGFGVVRVDSQSPFSLKLCARHQSDRFLETLGETVGDRLPEKTVQVPPHLLVRGKECLDALSLPTNQSLVLVHPGSGSVHKCLESRRMASLIDRLWKEGLYPLLLEGPADRDAVDQVLHCVSRPPFVLRDLDVLQLAGVCAQVAFYIGHDSGVTHLSAFMGVPTIALFGPTDHHRWAPQGNHVRVLHGLPCVCESWPAVKSCTEKPCLHVPVENILNSIAMDI